MEDLKRTRASSGRARRRVALAFATLLLIMALAVALAVVRDRGSGAKAAKAATTAPAGPPVRAWSSVVMDRSTGYVLYKKAPDRHLLPASCTKIMTAMLVLEHLENLDEYVTVPREAMHVHGALLGLHAGDRITVRSLLLGLMVKSATDCAVTLATRVSGDESKFAVLMNARASQLGLANTHYVNSSGQVTPGHYTSARDLAELGRVAMRNARFRDLARRVYATVKWPPDHIARLHSHNIFNETFDWVNGIKTGATVGAGCVLVASGTYHNRSLIVVTMHEPTRTQEFKDALKLYKWADALFGKRAIVKAGAVLAQIPIDTGGQVDAVAASGLSAMCRRAADVSVVLEAVPQSLAGQPAQGTSLGTAVYYADGGRLGAVPLVAP
ncbi:MAG TPA: D-alanyl-D-alanine carboxypeptidase family protein [Thermoleophilia bacterium]